MQQKPFPTSRSVPILDPIRQAQFGACYAASGRRVLSGVRPHLSVMMRDARASEWDAAYKSGIIVCRSALHVVHKVDVRRSPFFADALNERFGTWKGSVLESPFQQLDDERNKILKEGRSSFRMEMQDASPGERRFLVGTRFIPGSGVVAYFLDWILREVSAIEDTSYWARRNARLGPTSTNNVAE